MSRCILAALVIFPILLNSAPLRDTIEGIVLDAETNEPVSKAAVQLIENNIYRVTGEDGKFEFTNLKTDAYTLVVSHVAYHKRTITIKLSDKAPKQIVIYLEPKTIDVDPVIVSGEGQKTKYEELTESTSTLKGNKLQQELGQTLAATLKNETGLAMRTMGAAPARPVIRGLSGDRVQIAEDGNKTTDLSATSPDHAVTVEPFTLEKIEVIRGPKVLLKTPTTIGGIVNVIREEVPSHYHGGTIGNLGLYGETVNSGYLGSAGIEVPVGTFMIKADASRRKAGDSETPSGKLNNSYSQNSEYGISGSYLFDNGYIGTAYREFSLDYGVPGGFVGAHPNGVDIEMFKRRMVLRGEYEFSKGFFKSADFNLSRVYYRHMEFESADIIGAEFKILDYAGHINFRHKNFSFIDNGTFGISFDYRDFDIGGFVFTPPSKSLNLSAFFYESVSTQKISHEFAGRLNYDKITPEYEDPDANIGSIRERDFLTYSLSFSTLYEFSNSIYAGFNLSKSSRVPTIEELYSEGPHLAAYSYETGNPELETESGFGSEIFGFYRTGILQLTLTGFYNNLSSYIIPRNTGETNFQTFLPIYSSEGVPALLYGYEIEGKLDFLGKFSFTGQFSFTEGRIKNGGWLPQIPPLKGVFELNYNSSGIKIYIRNESAAGQERTDEFEEPTKGYSVFACGFLYSIKSGSFVHNLSLNVDNLLNTEYRNHLSRIKSVLPEPGRSFRAVYKLFFQF